MAAEDGNASAGQHQNTFAWLFGTIVQFSLDYFGVEVNIAICGISPPTSLKI